jgi:hypothetical protein
MVEFSKQRKEKDSHSPHMHRGHFCCTEGDGRKKCIRTSKGVGGLTSYEIYDPAIMERTTFQQQTFQLSRILRETHAFDIFLTLTRINTIFSHKSEKIGSDPTFVLTLILFASKYSCLAESIAIK